MSAKTRAMHDPDDDGAPHDHRRYLHLALVAIVVVFGGFGVWAAMAPLDSAAIAPARVAVEGDRRPVQHLEGGIVREIFVRSAQSVTEGDVLFRLDGTTAQATVDLVSRQLDALLAQEARLLAEREGRTTIEFPPELLSRAGGLGQLLVEQSRLLSERRDSTETSVNILEARIEQTGREIEGRERRMIAFRSQHSSLVAEIESVRPIVERGFFALNRFRALEREAAQLEGEIGSIEGDIARLEQVVAEARIEIRQTRQRVQEEQTLTLAEVRGKLSDLRERLGVATAVLSRLEVRAPATGIALDVAVSTPGAVIAPGAVLVEIVPPLERLTLNARVSPLDIQSVAPGQTAEIRFSAFSGRTADPIFGVVERVSADAIEDPSTRETFFQAKIVTAFDALPPEIAERIVPGMPAEVLIVTGERTMLTYLLAPLRDTMARAMRDE